jgi:hypothetical protein
MSTIKKLIFLVVGIVFFIGCMFWWWDNQAKPAAFFVSCLTTVGVVSAVALALYGDFLREVFYPVRIKIEPVPERDSNQFIDTEKINDKERRIYCHHLRVRNLTKGTLAKNCRVWLKRITAIDEFGSEIGPPLFAVPRLMEWAPSEWSRSERTFSTSQLFDLGKTLDDNEGFLLTIERDQGQALQCLNVTRETRKPGARLKCVIYVTADNYHQQEEFTFHIVVKSIRPSDTTSINASVVVAVSR